MRRFLFILSILLCMVCHAEKTVFLLDSTVYYDGKGKKSSYQTYVYDSYNRLMEKDYYHKDVDTFYCQNREEYIYNKENKLECVVTWLFKQTEQSWRRSTKECYVYNKDNQLESKMIYSWKSSTDDWSLRTSFNYNYDADGYEIGNEGYKWDATSEDWTNMSKVVYILTPSGYITIQESYLWNPNSKSWVKESICNYEYDDWMRRESVYSLSLLYGNESKEIYSYDDSGNLSCSALYAIYDGSDLQLMETTRYYYSCVADLDVDVMIVQKSPIKRFVNGQLLIQIGEHVYDMLGHCCPVKI